MGRFRPIMCALFCLGFVRGAAAETVEEAVEKLAAAEAKVKSLTAKFKQSQKMDLGEGMKSESQSEGTMEWMRKGDKKLAHTTMKTTGMQSFSGQETKFSQSATSIMDGEFGYTLTEQDGQKSAMKTKAEMAMDDNPKAFIADMKEDHELKLLPDETVDGAACCVIEAVSKSAQNEPIAKQVFYFRRDSGINVKMVGKDKNDKVVLQHELTDVKLNADIPADRFVFKAPEGVQVMDMTQAPDPTKQP